MKKAKPNGERTDKRAHDTLNVTETDTPPFTAVETQSAHALPHAAHDTAPNAETPTAHALPHAAHDTAPNAETPTAHALPHAAHDTAPNAETPTAHALPRVAHDTACEPVIAKPAPTAAASRGAFIPRSESQKTLFAIRFLCAVCAVFAFLLCIGFFYTKARRTLEHKKTALLNPVNVSKCSELSFTHNGATLTLYKKDGVWFGVDKNITFFADSAMVSSFFDSLSKTRTVYHVSSSQQLLARYGVTDETAFRITARLEDGTIATDLYFGFESDSAPRIYFRSGKTLNVYQTENDVYPFLHTENRYWAHQCLFMEGAFSFSDEDVVRVLFDGAPLFLHDEAALGEYLSVLKNTRSAILIHKAELLQKTPLHRITIECVKETFTVKMYEYGENYALFAENPWCNFCLEVSPWSYERLMPKTVHEDAVQ